MDLGRFETALNVKNIERTLAFYKALGFRQTDGAVDIGTVGLRGGDCRLTLFQGHLSPPRTQLIFWQGDVMAIARDLVGKGLTFDEGHPRSDDRGNASAMMKDPDGHPIFFINMPINYVDVPGHARKSPPYRPKILKPDMRLGWFELSLDVEDLGRSVAFYEKLWFRRVDDGSVERNATMQNGDCRISLYQGYLDPAVSQLIFWQGNVEAVAKRAARKGLAAFNGPSTDKDGGVALMLKDPDDVPLYFVNIPGVTRGEPA